jgi:hypothetical protein
MYRKSVVEKLAKNMLKTQKYIKVLAKKAQNVERRAQKL